MKKNILFFILGLMIAGSIGVYATIKVQSSEIGYKDGTVEDALNDLYQAPTVKKICQLQDGYTAGEIGAKYKCKLNNTTEEYFFILAIKENKTILLAEKNLSDTVGSKKIMSWYEAIEFFEKGQAGYTTKTSWTNVLDVDLPSVQDIVDASLIINPKDNFNFNATTEQPTWWCLGSHVKDEANGPTYCTNSNLQQKTGWMFDYLRDCASRGCTNSYDENDTTHSYGYWTRDLTADTTKAWYVNRYGSLFNRQASSDTVNGIRPVITVLTSNLYE